MKYSFENIKLFTWYEGRHPIGKIPTWNEDPFFVYRKTLPDNIDTIEYSAVNVGGFVIQGYHLDYNWELENQRSGQIKDTEKYLSNTYLRAPLRLGANNKPLKINNNLSSPKIIQKLW